MTLAENRRLHQDQRYSPDYDYVKEHNKKGVYADFLIVDGNPLEDIKILGDPAKNLKLIMKDGKIYKNTI